MQIVNKTELDFLDGVVEHLRLLLGTNLSWLTMNYGEAFNFEQSVDGQRVYVPNAYIQNTRYQNLHVDNNVTGQCFFIVGDSSSGEYSMSLNNYYTTPISIVFEVNMELSSISIADEYTREKHIVEVLNVLKTPRGSYYKIEDVSVIRQPQDVFSEYGFDPRKEYKYPLTCFRIDLNINHKSECITPIGKSCELILDSLDVDTLVSCVIPNIDFCSSVYRNALTASQIECICDSNMLDIYPQNVTDLGDISGAFNFDYNNNSWQRASLVGDITSFNYINFPTVQKGVNFNFEVTQSGTGDYVIDFVGSGLIPGDGISNDDLQPKIGLGEKTLYSFAWDGNDLRIFKSSDGDTL